MNIPEDYLEKMKKKNRKKDSKAKNRLDHHITKKKKKASTKNLSISLNTKKLLLKNCSEMKAPKNNKKLS